MRGKSGHDRRDRRIFIALLILLFISVGNVFTKFTVHDADGLSVQQQRCGREGVRRELSHTPLMRVLIRFGDVEVTHGESAEAVEVWMYTLWRIPIGKYQEGFFVPKGMAFACTWDEPPSALER
jgi:hypothetical protein